MEVEVKVVKTVTIVLNEREAKWLKSVMQNPLSTPEAELDKEMRHTFWDALEDVSL